MHVLLAVFVQHVFVVRSFSLLNFRRTIMAFAFALSLTFVEWDELGVESVWLCVCCPAVTVVAR